jgi:hypothetical protein
MLRKFFWINFSFAGWLGLLLGGTFFIIHMTSIMSHVWFDFNSTEMNVEVIALEERPMEINTLFRPVFAVVDSDGTQVEYTGTTWVWPKPHNLGDIVIGRYNASTGVINSEAMLSRRRSFDNSSLISSGTFTLIAASFLV